MTYWGNTAPTAEIVIRSDGERDMTEVLQTTIDKVPSGSSIRLVAGSTYLVRNLVIPNKRLSIVSDGNATIKAIGAGDSRYLLTHAAWLNYTGFADVGVELRNITLDANDVKDYAHILMAYSSRCENVLFRGALVAGQNWTGVASDGSEIPGAVGGQSFIGCDYRLNNGKGFVNSAQVADAQFTNCRFRENGTGGMYLNSSAGVAIILAKFWGNNLVDAAAADLHARKWGYSQLMGCNFEGVAVIFSANSIGTPLTIGPGNLFYTTGGLVIRAETGTAPNTTKIIVSGIHLEGEAYIEQNLNDISREIYVEGGVSDAARPFRWAASSANPQGKIICHRHWSNGANGWLDGPIKSGPISSALPYAANIPMPVRKQLSAGTTTTSVLTLTVPALVAGASSRVTLRFDAMMISSVAPLVRRWKTNADVVYGRKYAAADNYYDVTYSAPVGATGSGMSIAEAVVVSGTTGDHTVTITFTLTHDAPLTVADSYLLVSAEADHYGTTVMTLA